jgi:hypothetical protein
MDLDAIQNLQEAIGTVEHVLDVLGQQGRDEEAFRLAQAQFAASVRNSWPGNLSGLVEPLERILTNEAVCLPAEDQERLKTAIATLRGVSHD